MPTDVPVMVPQEEKPAQEEEHPVQDDPAEVTRQIRALTDPDAVLESAVRREAQTMCDLNRRIQRRLSPAHGIAAIRSNQESRR